MKKIIITVAVMTITPFIAFGQGFMPPGYNYDHKPGSPAFPSRIRSRNNTPYYSNQLPRVAAPAQAPQQAPAQKLQITEPVEINTKDCTIIYVDPKKNAIGSKLVDPDNGKLVLVSSALEVSIVGIVEKYKAKVPFLKTYYIKEVTSKNGY